MLSTAAWTTEPRSLMADPQSLPDEAKSRGVRHPTGMSANERVRPSIALARGSLFSP